jgi:hypothetical protein
MEEKAEEVRAREAVETVRAGAAKATVAVEREVAREVVTRSL